MLLRGQDRQEEYTARVKKNNILSKLLMSKYTCLLLLLHETCCLIFIINFSAEERKERSCHMFLLCISSANSILVSNAFYMLLVTIYVKSGLFIALIFLIHPMVTQKIIFIDHIMICKTFLFISGYEICVFVSILL